MKADRSRRTAHRSRPADFRPSEPGTESGLIRIYGRKPVIEALRIGVVQRIEIARGAHGRIIADLAAIARTEKVEMLEVEGWAEDEPGVTQGIRALARPPALRHDLRQFAEAFPADEQPVLLMLDGVTDPHNFGAILRTAAAANVAAVVIRDRRQAPVTEVVVKASAGVAYLVPIFTVTNLSSSLRDLAERGFWSVAAAGLASARTYTEYDWKRRLVLVVGSEGEGVSELVLRSVDDIVRIPLPAHVDSLNVSVATGILLFECARCRFR
ncbi:23S rRNA (guanosine(2251)-2'-O)-methyltransferase RlmB [candidate division KSB1 bacterium]|nr:23S rRNA (guanosine(2251)-2'-O)-methyltransferase RlmB [candidate division KSB1 bacterium]